MENKFWMVVGAVIAIIVVLWIVLKLLASLWFLAKGLVFFLAILFLVFLYIRYRVKKWESEQDS